MASSGAKEKKPDRQAIRLKQTATATAGRALPREKQIRRVPDVSGRSAPEHFAFEMIQFQKRRCHHSPQAGQAPEKRGFQAHCFSRCDEGSYGWRQQVVTTKNIQRDRCRHPCFSRCRFSGLRMKTASSYLTCDTKKSLSLSVSGGAANGYRKARRLANGWRKQAKLANGWRKQAKLANGYRRRGRQLTLSPERLATCIGKTL